MKIFKKAKRGFTLVELVVVIAVIAILAAVSVGAYFGVTESANKSKLEQESKQFHTAIQTVALAGNENHTLNADGLRVVDLKTFEDALEETMGQDIEVLADVNPAEINKQTIVLNNTSVKEQNNGNLYKTFDYYTHEVGGKKIAVDTVTGEFKHYGNLNFKIDTEDTAEAEFKTIYFENNWHWPDAAIHYWGSEKVAETSWPGMALTNKVGQNSTGNDIYEIEIPSDIDGFCFTGTGQYGFEQSNDVEAENIEYNVCYYMMYSDENGKYVEYYAYPPVETPDSPDTPEEPVTTRPVYFANRRWDMTNKKMYVYGFATSENNGWPGEEMSLYDSVEHLYYFEINTKYTTLVFNNGQNGNQTDDVSLLDGYNEEQGLVFYNVETKEWEEIPTEIPAPQYDDIGVIGDFEPSNWTSDVKLSTTDGVTYTGTFEFEKDTEFKFRMNGDYKLGEWDFNSLSSNEPDALAASGSNIKVTKAGTFNFTFVLGEEKPISYSFVEKEYVKYTLTVVSTIEGATISLNATGFTSVENTIEVHENTTVFWSVTKDGYIPQSGSELVTEDKTLTITLEIIEPEHTCNFDGDHICDCGEVEDGYKIFYFDISNKGSDNAWFAIRVWKDGNDSIEEWIKLTLVSGTVYTATIDIATYDLGIVTRNNPSLTDLSWESKWNQSGDLTLPKDEKNLWTWGDDAWDGAEGTWSTK